MHSLFHEHTAAIENSYATIVETPSWAVNHYAHILIMAYLPCHPQMNNLHDVSLWVAKYEGTPSAPYYIMRRQRRTVVASPAIVFQSQGNFIIRKLTLLTRRCDANQ